MAESITSHASYRIMSHLFLVLTCLATVEARNLSAIAVVLLLLPSAMMALMFPTASTKCINLQNLTRGESGPVCTSIKRRCLKDIPCVGKVCHCPAGQTGRGTIECVKDGTLLCMVAADPHATTYGHAKADVDLPCRYRLTRFIANHISQNNPHAKCSVEVYAINELSKGRYYVRGVHVTIGIIDPNRQRHDVFEIHKYGTSEQKVYKYLSNVNHTLVVWGSSVHEKFQEIKVFPTFDLDNNFAVLYVPQCDVRVKYRCFNPASLRQPMLPGVTVMAPSDAIFTEGFGNYPKSLCGVKNDSADLFTARAQQLGLANKQLAVIYDILDQAFNQRGNPRHAECKRAFRAFNESANKVEDLNACGVILTDRNLRICVSKKAGAPQPIEVFTACLRFRQTSAVADCSFLKNTLSECGGHQERPDLDLTSCLP